MTEHKTGDYFTPKYPKTWSEMTPQERIDIFTASERGVEIEVSVFGTGWSVQLPYAGGTIFSNHAAYRIKSVEPIEIPWEVVADKFKWATADADGTVSLFTEQPYPGSAIWYARGGSYSRATLIKHRRGTVPWDQSLIKRPE